MAAASANTIHQKQQQRQQQSSNYGRITSANRNNDSSQRLLPWTSPDPLPAAKTSAIATVSSDIGDDS